MSPMKEVAKTILIVDDEPDVLAYLSALLEDHGFSTCTAKDGREAESALTSITPDLITLDITMPQKSGAWFYRRIREHSEWGNIPVIIITGVESSQESFVVMYPHLRPPEGFLSKPIDHAAILQLVAELVA